jgi:hypothetical protein
MESKEQQWTKIEKFYQELLDVYHWDQRPMAYLVYNMKSEIFEGHFQQGQGVTVKLESFGKEINKRILDSVEEWLSTNASQQSI